MAVAQCYIKTMLTIIGAVLFCIGCISVVATLNGGDEGVMFFIVGVALIVIGLLIVPT